MASFGNEVAAYVDRYKKRLRATAKESVQETVDIAQKTRGEGGRMRVDTGFLRASIAAKVGSMPSGESENNGQPASYEGSAVSAELLRWNPDKGETIFVGWSASYARPREAEDGFMRGATEKWPDTVDKVAEKVKRSI